MTRAVLRLAMGLVLPACSRDAFLCSDDSSCEKGRCEPSGYCSFPDDDCPSGFAYGEHAGGLSGQCVGAGGTETGPGPGGTETGPGVVSDTGSSAGGTFTSEPGATLALDGSSSGGGPSATSNVDSSTGAPTTAGTTDTSSGGSSDDDSTGTSSQSPCPGGEILHEAFDAWPPTRATWTYFDATGVAAHVTNDAVYFDFDTTVATTNYEGIETITALPSASAGFVLEILAAPPNGIPAEHVIGLGAFPEPEWGFALTNGYLRTYDVPSGAYVQREQLTFDPVDHRWLRVTVDGMTVLWEVSPDAEEWTEVDSDVLAAAPDTLDVDLAGGAFGPGLQVENLIGFDNLYLCGP